MKLNLDEMKVKANAATKGKRVFDYHPDRPEEVMALRDAECHEADILLCTDLGNGPCGVITKADADFISICDTETILALLKIAKCAQVVVVEHNRLYKNVKLGSVLDLLDALEGISK